MGGILAIDQATVTGWAWSEPGGAPEWGHKQLGGEGADDGKVGAAMSVLLEARIAHFKPDWIVYEAPYVPRPSPNAAVPPINPQTLRRLLGLAFLIDTIADQHGIGCREVTTAAFTRYFVGRGKFPSREAKKRATVERCKLLGWKATSDEADALALLCFAEAKLFRIEAMRRSAGPLFDQSALVGAL